MDSRGYVSCEIIGRLNEGGMSLKKSLMKVQLPVSSDYTDEHLKFIKQMGVDNCFVMFKDEDSNYEGVNRFLDRCRKAGLTINDAGNANIYKHPSIPLGLPDRDLWIDKYIQLNRILANAGVKTGYVTWDAGRVSTSRFAPGEKMRGAEGRIVDMGELYRREPAFGRIYEEEEIWSNFKYFMDCVLPVCEETGMRLALHPNDPPAASLEGFHNLIHSAADYKKAFELVNDSPYLGMKMCCGCWLEGGPAFGDLLADIKYFVERNKVFIVHFRNVSAYGDYFEETLIEDGYMDMYAVMKQFVACGYDGAIHCDHVPVFSAQHGGKDSSFAYSTGYMKALIHCAQAEL